MILPPVFALLNVSAVTALVGTNPVRVYGQGNAPQTAPLPHVTWNVIAGTTPATLDRPGMDNHRVQVDCWAADNATGKALAIAVRDAMENGGDNVMVSFNGNDIDPETKQYRWSMDFSIWTPRE